MKATTLVKCSVTLFCLMTVFCSAARQAENLETQEMAENANPLSLMLHDNIPKTSATGIFPTVIPRTLPSADPTGTVETFNAAAPTYTATNAFFQSLGSNGRACATCHEPRSAWSISVESIQQRFHSSQGTDPLFRLVDGANCSSDDISTPMAKRAAFSTLLAQGLIRIALPLPTTQLNSNPAKPPDYQITDVDDPYGCTDLTSSQPTVSVYRRPLPSANLRFLTECPPGEESCPPLTIMFDGREPSLESQAKDATMIHAQAQTPPTGAQIAEIVNFESQLYDAQVRDHLAGDLYAKGASGGPFVLSEEKFYIGLNDVLGADPLAPGVFSTTVFNLYSAWGNLPEERARDERRQREFHLQAERRRSIARGETLFNTKQFTINEVNGLNLFPFDPLGAKPMTTGSCTICHDAPNIGNHSKKLAINIGVSDANPPVLNVARLPVFTIACTDSSGPLQGRVFKVTDPARALITGDCADTGKVKGPILHGLAARAPYFHNGSAATLADVVEFYNQRFNIGLTDQEKTDLEAFLQAL
jgi:cytochrome c peroxidase